jgi:hypothetical protein
MSGLGMIKDLLHGWRQDVIANSSLPELRQAIREVYQAHADIEETAVALECRRDLLAAWSDLLRLEAGWRNHLYYVRHGANQEQLDLLRDRFVVSLKLVSLSRPITQGALDEIHQLVQRSQKLPKLLQNPQMTWEKSGLEELKCGIRRLMDVYGVPFSEEH